MKYNCSHRTTSPLVVLLGPMSLLWEWAADLSAHRVPPSPTPKETFLQLSVIIVIAKHWRSSGNSNVSYEKLFYLQINWSCPPRKLTTPSSCLMEVIAIVLHISIMFLSFTFKMKQVVTLASPSPVLTVHFPAGFPNPNAFATYCCPQLY